MEGKDALHSNLSPVRIVSKLGFCLIISSVPYIEMVNDLMTSR